MVEKTAQAAPSLEVLKKAKALIEAPEAWGKGSYGRDANGAPVGSHSPRAVCFCALGAIGRAAAGLGSQAQWNAADIFMGVIPSHFDYIENFNDASATTHADVLTAFDKAIAIAALSQGAEGSGHQSSSEKSI